jgi:hypothetical protein
MADSPSIAQEVKNEALGGVTTTGEVKGKEAEEQTQVHDASAMIFTSESQPEGSDAEFKDEGKGKGKERQIEEGKGAGEASGGQAGGAGVTVTELGNEPQAGAQFQDEAKTQDTMPGPSNEMAPPPIPPPQDPSSEAISITASSVSNPTLEVDTQVSRSTLELGTL